MGTLKVDGNLLLTGDIRMQTSNVLSSVIQVKADSNGYGQNLLIGAGGNTVIGGGESASTFFTASGIKDEENLYLTADGSIHVYTNCDSIANRKLVMSMGADGNITTTGTIITPGNDSVVIKPAKNNYDQIGASDCKFWKIHAGTFYGNLSGNADTASRLLNKYNISGDSHSLALKAAFDTYKNSTPKDEFLTYYSSAYGNGSMYMGYFISGYDSTPYGGFYVAHYNTPYYVGIQYGSYEQQTILTSSNYATWCAPASHSHSYLPLSGGTMTGSPVIKFPASEGSIAASDPMAITYGRISAYGTLCINANTDNSGTEYIILTAGKGLSSSTTDGLAIGTSTLTWQGSTVLTKRDRGYAYTALSSCYTAGSTPTYYRIIFPDNQVGMWNMVTMELTVRQKYDSGTGGKIIINAYHSSGDWTGFTAYVDGYMSHDIKVYGSGGKYFYISGCGAWSTLSIDKMIISDGAVNVDLTDTTCDYVTSMPSGYSTATMSYGLTSTNYSSYCAPASHSHSYLPLGGGTLTGPLQVNSTIFGYNYANSNNAAAFIWDKNGSNYTGVGSCNTTDMIHFGPCNVSGAWVSNYNQIWRFQGGVYATGWLETDNYGTGDPGTSTPGYGRGGAIYFKVVG